MARQHYPIESITIEKNIPVPERWRGQSPSPWTQLLLEMEIGDSIVVPNEKVASSLYSSFRKKGRRCACREIQNGLYRVWRVA